MATTAWKRARATGLSLMAWGAAAYTAYTATAPVSQPLIDTVIDTFEGKMTGKPTSERLLRSAAVIYAAQSDGWQPRDHWNFVAARFSSRLGECITDEEANARIGDARRLAAENADCLSEFVGVDADTIRKFNMR